MRTPRLSRGRAALARPSTLGALFGGIGPRRAPRWGLFRDPVRPVVPPLPIWDTFEPRGKPATIGDLARALARR